MSENTGTSRMSNGTVDMMTLVLMDHIAKKYRPDMTVEEMLEILRTYTDDERIIFKASIAWTLKQAQSTKRPDTFA